LDEEKSNYDGLVFENGFCPIYMFSPSREELNKK
jgi:hypothetical protein